MMVCTFFGHRDAPEEAKRSLEIVVENLINQKGVDLFYVGNQGKFDQIVWKVLVQMREKYSHIRCFKVLAYFPIKRIEDEEDSIYPEGLESKPLKFAISHRNRWMIERSDYVVTYVRYGWGGAAQAKNLAEKKGKKVLNLPDKL